MFYVADSCGDYDYVLDSDDGSCEMVLRGDLKRLEIAYNFLPRKSIDPYKIKMMYKSFSPKLDSIFFDMGLMHYRLCTDDGSLVYVYVGLKLVKASYIINYKGSEKYIAVLYAKSPHFLFNTAFQCFKFRFSNLFDFYGLKIPECMLHYIMRLYRDKDSDKLFSAFNGLLTYGVARDRNIVSVYNIEWET